MKNKMVLTRFPESVMASVKGLDGFSTSANALKFYSAVENIIRGYDFSPKGIFHRMSELVFLGEPEQARGWLSYSKGFFGNSVAYANFQERRGERARLTEVKLNNLDEQVKLWMDGSDQVFSMPDKHSLFY